MLEYTTEVLNRQTGNLEIKSLGEWITVTELGKKHGVGSRQIRHILKQMGLLETSYAGAGIHRHSLSKKAVEAGLGKQLFPTKKGSYPFDVFSPKGQQWVADRWDATVSKVESAKTSTPIIVEASARLKAFKASRTTDFTAQMEVCWLLDHYRDIAQTEICIILSLPKQTVSHWVKIRSKQLKKGFPTSLLLRGERERFEDLDIRQ